MGAVNDDPSVIIVTMHDTGVSFRLLCWEIDKTAPSLCRGLRYSEIFRCAERLILTDEIKNISALNDF